MPHALIVNGQPMKLPPGAPIWVGDIQYPWNITELWSEADLLALGVVTYSEPGEAPAGYRATGYTLDVQGGNVVAVLTTEAIPLADLKAARTREAEDAYTEKLAVGYPVTLDGQAETLQLRNSEDRTNWLGLLLAAQAGVAAGYGAANYPAKIRTTSNTGYTVTNAEAVGLMFDLLGWAASMFQARSNVKDAISAAANAAAVASVDVNAGYP